MGEKNNAVIYGEIVSKCWEDENFKKKFVAAPESVLADAGFKLEEGVTYKVIEAPKLVKYVVIPYEGAKEAVQKISAGLLESVEKAAMVVPEGVEVRIVQNTDDIRNLILPASPKTLTAAELKAISGGDATVVMPSTSTNVSVATNDFISTSIGADLAASIYVNMEVAQELASVLVATVAN